MTLFSSARTSKASSCFQILRQEDSRRDDQDWQQHLHRALDKSASFMHISHSHRTAHKDKKGSHALHALIPGKTREGYSGMTP